MNTTEDNPIEENTRPLGYWLKATDRLLAAEFARAFESEGVTRRDWRMLNRIDGTAPGGIRSDRPLRGPRVRSLAERGWIERTHGDWALTDAGREAKERLGTIVAGVRQRVADALTPEEHAALTSSLERIAREFGWQEGMSLPRRERPHGRRRGHGRHHGHGGHHGHDHHRRDRREDRPQRERGHRHEHGRRHGHERAQQGDFRPGLARDPFTRRPFARDPFTQRPFGGHPFGGGEQIHVHIHRH